TNKKQLMKISKLKSILLASCIVTTVSLSSCLNDNENITYFTELGTVRVTSKEASLPVVEGDIYGKSTITNKSILSHYDADSIGQRIMYTFSEDKTTQDVSTDQVIRIYELYRVLTKPMDTLSEDEEDVYGTDKVNIIGSYVSEEHLNIQFQVFANDRTIKHRISLVDTKGAYIDEKGFIHLEFRHNAEKDTQRELNWGFVSYTLASIPGYKEGTLKGFKIEYKSIYEGTVTKTIEMKSKEESKSFRMGSLDTQMAQ
ncbi:MAG: hypothetical protein ACRC8J_08355, partial [Phocaeicola sp.]